MVVFCLCRKCNIRIRKDLGVVLHGKFLCFQCMGDFKPAYDNKPLTICAFVPFYNEIGVLPALLDSLKSCPLVIACDGKWKNFIDKKAKPDGLSYDGSRELCKSYKNVVLIDMGNTSEEEMLTRCFQEAGKRGFNLALQLGADEYVEGSFEVVAREVKEKIISELLNIYSIKFETIHITPPSQKFTQLGRLHFDPGKIYVKDIHWFYWINGKRAKIGSLVKGIKIIHDDRKRSELREQQMADYQAFNYPRECAIMGINRPLKVDQKRK